MRSIVWSFVALLFAFEAVVAFAFVFRPRSKGSRIPVLSLQHQYLSPNVRSFSASTSTRTYMTWPGGNQFASSDNSLRTASNERTRQALIEAALSIEKSANRDALTTVRLVGKSTLPTTAEGPNVTCVVLTVSPTPDTFTEIDASVPCLLVPLRGNSNQLALLECVVRAEPLSMTSLYGYNLLFVNRDGDLYDNVPWTSWTVDPSQRNRDAANNVIDAKLHMGKRDAYNRFMGKDVAGRSQVLARLRQQKQQQETRMARQQTSIQGDEDGTNAMVGLKRRILQVEIRELEMEIAELDYELAVAREDDAKVDALRAQKAILTRDMEAARDRLETTDQTSDVGTGVAEVTWMTGLFQDRSRSNQVEVPYPGAMGYPPEKSETSQDQLYRSPYDLLKQILKEQLNAEVIGSVLENTSLLEGTTSLSGVLILRRVAAQKSAKVLGEEVTMSDEDEEFGNPGIRGGELVVVECDADEAIAMSLACDVPLQVETSILEVASLMAHPVGGSSKSRQELLEWTSLNPELSVLVEGQAGNESSTERASPLRIPRTTSSLFDTVMQDPPVSASKDLFPSDNPIQSLSQYDNMSNEDKARVLMALSNFDGKLPRPRTVRQSQRMGAGNALDALLLPLVDESVRRQYQIRDATQKGDMDLVRTLTEEKSQRQIAKEKAEQAREKQADDVADWWEAEAEFLEALRADATQDEGSYSRFLDRDDWYERSRQQQAKRVNKKQFGNLLDGVE
jgi:hypothetical protein